MGVRVRVGNFFRSREIEGERIGVGGRRSIEKGSFKVVWMEGTS